MGRRQPRFVHGSLFQLQNIRGFLSFPWLWGVASRWDTYPWAPAETGDTRRAIFQTGGIRNRVSECLGPVETRKDRTQGKDKSPEGSKRDEKGLSKSQDTGKTNLSQVMQIRLRKIDRETPSCFSIFLCFQSCVCWVSAFYQPQLASVSCSPGAVLNITWIGPSKPHGKWSGIWNKSSGMLFC